MVCYHQNIIRRTILSPPGHHFHVLGAFVEERQILDVVLIANELVDEKRRSKEEGVVFKINIEKVYDHVDWGFLDHELERKRFSLRWRS